ncbi:MAG: glycosyltransferase family 2 protein [Thermoguttaceae bacterium]
MPAGPLVSVVMPAFRADRWIAEALESVRRQSYTHWELIVVEDGSRGLTEQIVGDFARQVPWQRVVYVRHETNQGPSASRNTALAHARGPFLAFLDADDLWTCDHLAASLRALEEQGADVAYATAVTFDDKTGMLLGLWGPTREELASFPASLLRRPYIIPSATVVRRRALDAAGLFDPAIRFGEDLDLWLRCLQAGMRFVHVPGCHCLWRKGRAEAASSDLLACVEGLARVRRKNETLLGGISRRLQRQCEARGLAAAGRSCLGSDRRRSGQLLWRAWRLQPGRIDLLGLAAAACFPPLAAALKRLKHAVLG